MNLTDEQKHALGAALEEATLLGVEVDADMRSAAATFSVLTLPEHGPAPADPRVQFRFERVGRVAASLRLGRWNDASAAVVPFRLDELLSTVQGFGGLAVYGAEFFDCEDDFATWQDRLSLDWRSEAGDLTHSIVLFQEGHDRHLDLRIWFGDLEIRSPSGEPIGFEEFYAGSKRWWDGLRAGDPRATGAGIIPLDDWEERA